MRAGNSQQPMPVNWRLTVWKIPNFLRIVFKVNAVCSQVDLQYFKLAAFMFIAQKPDGLAVPLSSADSTRY